MNNNIITTYNNLKKKYNDIVDINPERLNKISEIRSCEKSNNLTNKYILFSSFVLSSIVFFPIGYNYIKKIIKVIVAFINESSFTFFKNYITEISGFMFFLKVTILVSIFIIPFVFNYFVRKRIVESKTEFDIDRGDFIPVMSLLAFFTLGFLGIVFNIYFDLNINDDIMSYFEFFLNIIFSLLIYFMVLKLIFNIPYLKRLKNNEYNTNLNYRLNVSFELLFMLKKIDTEEHLDKIDLIRSLESNIYSITNSIKNISYDYDTNQTEIDKKKLNGISNAFYYKFMSLLHLESNNTSTLKNEIIKYFNMFINGSIVALPIKEVPIKKKVNKKNHFCIINYIFINTLCNTIYNKIYL